MCFDSDYDFYYFSSCTRTARKVHRCDECGGEIVAGEKYRRSAGAYEGRIVTFVACARCDALRDAIKVRESEAGCYGSEAICPDGYLRDYLSQLDHDERSSIYSSAGVALPGEEG